jgi:hypothetical protein
MNNDYKEEVFRVVRGRQKNKAGHIHIEIDCPYCDEHASLCEDNFGNKIPELIPLICRQSGLMFLARVTF